MAYARCELRLRPTYFFFFFIQFLSLLLVILFIYRVKFLIFNERLLSINIAKKVLQL